MGYPSINKITKDDLADSLIREIELGAESGVYGSVKKNVVEYRETLIKVPFIGNEIEDYDPEHDKLEVFLNTVRLTEGVHYTIDPINKAIVSTNENGWVWDSTVEAAPNLFEFFVLTLNSPGNLVFGIDNMSEEVLQLIKSQQMLVQTHAKTGTVTITTKEKSISYIVGDITYYDPSRSALYVYADGHKLISGVDYTVDEVNRTITRINDEWDGTTTPITFELVMLTGLVADIDDNDLFDDIADLKNRVSECEAAIEEIGEGSLEEINKEIESLKSSVSDGKSMVAAAITDKGVETASTATFKELSDNISMINVGASTGNATPDKVLAGYTFSTDDHIGLEGTIPSILGYTHVPSTEDTVIAKGQYIESDIVVSGDNDLISGNIRFGSTIFTIEGTFTGDATATAEDIPEGKIAYAKGEMITGTKPYYSSEIIPAVFDITLPYGELIDNIVIKGDENLVSENIAYGRNIFGVEGSYTNDATANSSNILAGETAYVKGKLVTGVIESQSSMYVRPTTTDTIIPHGKYLAGDITVEGAPNLKPENIRNGITLFGVTGNAIGAISDQEFTIMAADAELDFTTPGAIQLAIIATATGVSTWVVGKYFAPEGGTMIETSEREVKIEDMHITLKLSEDGKTITYTNEYGLQANAKAIVQYM